MRMESASWPGKADWPSSSERESAGRPTSHWGTDPGQPGSGTWPAGLGERAVAAPEIGNPAEYQHDWFFQKYNWYCVPSSITQVIEAQSGQHIHSYALVEKEISQLHLPGTGLDLPQAQEVLAGFNVPSHIVTAGSAETGISDLADYLHEGRSIILAVNASPIWYGSETAHNPDGHADHALVVSAVNTQTREVTLSDPGNPNGNEETVPLSVFLDAWSASDYSMLVTDHTAGTEVHQTDVGIKHVELSVSTPHVHLSESVILPIAFGAGILLGGRNSGR